MAKDKLKQRIASKKHYSLNRGRMIDRAKRYSSAQVIILSEFVRKYKEARPCADCKNKFPHYVMDFDHVCGKKRDNVSTMVNQCVSLSTLKLEIEKCEVVCSNCHRVRTWLRLQNKVKNLCCEPEEKDLQMNLFS